MDLLRSLAARAGLLTGAGLNHENEAFVGKMTVASILGGRAVTLHYTATGADGQVLLHEEFTLLARADDQRLCLWPVMQELATVMPHLETPGVTRSTADAPARAVFATGPRDAVDGFREEIGIECLPGGGIRYSHAWGMPGGAFEARSSCELQPLCAPAPR